MGRRSGSANTDEEIARLTLAELDAEIARCRMWRTIAAKHREFHRRLKPLEGRLHRLEKIRARRVDE